MKTDKQFKLPNNVTLTVDFWPVPKKNVAGYIRMAKKSDSDFFAVQVWGNTKRFIKVLRAAADHLEKVSGKK